MSSLVTTTFIVFLPTFKVVLPSISIVAFGFSASAKTLIFFVLYGTVIVYFFMSELKSNLTPSISSFFNLAFAFTSSSSVGVNLSVTFTI